MTAQRIETLGAGKGVMLRYEVEEVEGQLSMRQTYVARRKSICKPVPIEKGANESGISFSWKFLFIDSELSQIAIGAPATARLLLK